MKRFAALTVGVLCAGALTISAQTLKVTATNAVGATCCAVMWITNATNVFQRTFGLWDQGDADHLKVWNSKKTNNTIDGTTAATVRSGASFNATWTCKGSTGAIVADGTYKYYIEICRDGPTPQHVVGSIVVDGTTKTKTGIDSGTSAGATSLTNVTAVYTAPLTGIVTAKQSVKPSNPLEFSAPAGFAAGSLVSVKMVSFDGKILWQKRFLSPQGGSFVLSRREILAAGKAAGPGFLVADFAGVKVMKAFPLIP
jgi:hypothetical protein